MLKDNLDKIEPDLKADQIHLTDFEEKYFSLSDNFITIYLDWKILIESNDL